MALSPSLRSIWGNRKSSLACVPVVRSAGPSPSISQYHTANVTTVLTQINTASTSTERATLYSHLGVQTHYRTMRSWHDGLHRIPPGLQTRTEPTLLSDPARGKPE